MSIIIIIIVITPDNNKITGIVLTAGDGLILLGIPPSPELAPFSL